MAFEKWKAVAGGLKNRRIVVAADTIVVLEGEIFGKPQNKRDAERMLRRLSGKYHEVLSAVVVGWSSVLHPRFVSVKTRVGFRKLSGDEILAYLTSGEWKGKAGAYGIQGKALRFTSSIDGSLTGVIGLPLQETLELIEKSFSQPPY